MNQVKELLFFVIAVGFLLLVVAIVAQVVTFSQAPATSGPDISRYVDKESGVVCWILGAHGSPKPIGISCLPIGSTKLDAMVR